MVDSSPVPEWQHIVPSFSNIYLCDAIVAIAPLACAAVVFWELAVSFSISWSSRGRFLGSRKARFTVFGQRAT